MGLVKSKHEKNPRYAMLLVAIGCSVLAYFWMQNLPYESSTQPEYWPHMWSSEAHEPVNYPELLERFDSLTIPSDGVLIRSLLSLLGMGFIAALLLIVARAELSLLVVILLLPGFCYMCLFTGGAYLGTVLFVDYTHLEHVDTVEFYGHVYHLTHATGMAGGMDVSIDELYVYECEPTGVTCNFVSAVPHYFSVPMDDPRHSLFLKHLADARFAISEDGLQLQVVSDGVAFFTLDAQP